MLFRSIVCSEHDGVGLFISIICIANTIGIMVFAKQSTLTNKIDQISLIIGLIILLSSSLYCSLRYMNKKLILSNNEIVCIDSFGQRKNYTVNQIKKVKIDDSVRFGRVEITFEDGYHYIMNRSATNYSELESIAKKEWQKLH